MSESPERRPPLDLIWAPWRMDYILEPRTDGCFLCAAVASGEDARNFVLERRQSCFSIFNRFPYNNGHLLVAPNAHKADLAALDDVELAELMRLTRDTQLLLAKAINPHGFNIGINLGTCAGAGVPGHLHIHIVPRWNGDTSFMPVLGGTKVIVQSLEALYKVLREQLTG
ncbi:MAG: HIT domain-containing protein [Planctomycetes bacterium]|nr:HIT domain-containing protein [Planctomycetota bacterium]